MEHAELNVVTGAFGYTGKYITRRLLAMGKRVVNLTGHPHRPNPFGEQVSVALFNFDAPDKLTESLRGATTLYNTYWVRFTHGQASYDQAIENTKTLIRAAEDAGVKRLVHVSIANPSRDSPLPYYRGKALLEEFIMQSKLSYAILRPTVIFGREDILINNIAWLLRKFPLFAVPGDGSYKMQPIYVEDVAELAVHAAQQSDNVVIDAVGPEIFTFDEWVRLIAEKVHSSAHIVHVNPKLAFWLSSIIGWFVRDVVITKEEIEGLMANLLVTDSAPTGKIRLSDWLTENAESVGARYASELGRHYDLSTNR